MDRELLKERLVLAERQVRLRASHIATQKAIIAKHVRDSLNATLARENPKTFEELQAVHIADRDRIAAELAKVSKR